MAAISVGDLVKHYGDVRAVDGVSFHVAEGEVYALLGENGAGKSTTVEILEGHRSRTSGSVEVLGTDPGHAAREFRDRIGIVLQRSGVEDELTVAEAVDVYGACYRRRRDTTEVIELVDLASQADRRDRRPVRRSAAPPRPGARHRRASGAAVPRRADDGLRPGGAAQRVGARAPAVLRRHHRAADDPLPRRGRAPGRPRRRAGRAGASSPRARRPSSSASGATKVGFVLPDGVSVEDLRGVIPGDAALVGDRVEFTTATPTAAVHELTGWALAGDRELVGLTVERPSLEDVFLSMASGRRDVMTDSFPRSGSLLVRQVRYQVLTFLRTPVAVFFTLLLPLIMLVLFNALFGSGEVDTGSGTWRFSQFYVGGIAAFTAASATFTNLANVVPIRREEGVLKRWRGTPLPPWIYLLGMILMSFVIAAGRRGADGRARHRRLRGAHRAGQVAGDGRDLPRRRDQLRRPRAGRRRRVQDGAERGGRRQRDHPADGVHLGRLHRRWRTRRGSSRSSATCCRSSRSPRPSRTR